MGLSITVEPLPEDSGSRSEIHEKDHRVHVDRSGRADASKRLAGATQGKRLGGATDSSRAVAEQGSRSPSEVGTLCDPAHAELRWADGGTIDVQTPSPSTLTVAITGTPAAASYPGCTSTATQTFQLIQEFEIACSDPSITRVCLTLDSTLAGYVRSKRKAGASVSLASASVSPASWIGPPLAVDHLPLCASGTEGRLCNQHLPPVQGPPMPLGRYTLVAFFGSTRSLAVYVTPTRPPTSRPIRACPPTG